MLKQLEDYNGPKLAQTKSSCQETLIELREKMGRDSDGVWPFPLTSLF